MAKAVLECTEPSLQIKKKDLYFEENASVRIGRAHRVEEVSESNGLLPNELFTVSYNHARITYFNNEFYLEDLSRNGTWINGFQVPKGGKHLLTSGDILQLSSESFSLEDYFPFPTFFIKLFKKSDIGYTFYQRKKNLYNLPLQLFNDFPNGDCCLEKLHDYVRERLKTLQILDQFGEIKHNNNSIIKRVLLSLKDNGLLDMLKLIFGTSDTFEEELDLQRMDHISHYFISLACCKNYVLKKWFLDQESKLIHIRWKFLHEHEKSYLINEYFSDFKVKNEVVKELSVITEGFIDPSTEYYQLPVAQISALVRSREVYVRAGYCFVPRNNLIVALSVNLVKHIKFNLKNMKANLHEVWNDDRISSLIMYIVKEVDFERFLFDKSLNSSIMLSDIDRLAENSFPLCMNELHYNLKKRNHLKNCGRQQYGLFLKGIGLSLKHALLFWRHYFTKKMSLENFIKNYQYHIYHSYGAVGKMADYPPQSCRKILEAKPSYGEFHGCPFKVLQNDDLLHCLARNKIKNNEVEEILALTSKGMPQMACKEYFRVKHNIELKEAPYHPNKYFEESQKVRGNAFKDNKSEGSKVSKNSAQNCSCHASYEW